MPNGCDITYYALKTPTGLQARKLFTSRQTAEHYAANHALWDKHYYQVVEADWRTREELFYTMGDNLVPPWDLCPIDGHYPHIAHSDATQIAFTASPDHGEIMRQTIMRPGRYLGKFYPDMSQKQIEYYVSWFLKGERPPADVDAELKFAASPDDIVAAYATGPASCMSDMDCVRVYGAGDLQIAYLETPAGKIIARSICWPEKEVYSRVYPTPTRYVSDGWKSNSEAESIQDLLYNMLRDKGWKSVTEHGTDLLHGARLSKIRDGHGYVMPYLDHCCVEDMGKYFVLARGGYSADNTNGYLDYDEDEDEDDEDYTTCEHCEECTHVDDTTGARHGRNGEDVTLCDYCHSAHTFESARSGDSIYDPDRRYRSELHDGDFVHINEVENYCTTCELTGHLYLDHDIRSVVTELHTMQTWGHDLVPDDAVLHDGVYYLPTCWLTCALYMMANDGQLNAVYSDIVSYAEAA